MDILKMKDTLGSLPDFGKFFLFSSRRFSDLSNFEIRGKITLLSLYLTIHLHNRITWSHQTTNTVRIVVAHRRPSGGKETIKFSAMRCVSLLIQTRFILNTVTISFRPHSADCIGNNKADLARWIWTANHRQRNYEKRLRHRIH
jgi:hypothetical protein